MSLPSLERESPVLPTVLVVDDERNIRRTLELVLSGENYRVLEAATGEDALETLVHGHHPVDLVILDLMLPGMSGLDVLERLQTDDSTRKLPVLVISGHATVEDAVKALKLGARDFFEKPLNRERILVSVRNALESAHLSREVEDLHAQMQDRYEMIGQSAVMQRVFREIDRVAPTKATVLISGESGTGKELISRAIHRLSPRGHGPFVKVNCAAIPRELIESELFGHERGAFTGAQLKRRGLFEQAHGGTLFLDEVGDMDVAAQAKVLRALQSGEIQRVGSEQTIVVDVRVLAATNKDLTREVQQGTFREDLYFRLAVFPLRSPNLRERPEDIKLLADTFLVAFCRENGLRPKTIDKGMFAELERRQWPGNVRELRNAIERAAILAGDVVTIADLPEDPHASPFDDDEAPVAVSLGSIPPPGSAKRTLREVRDRAERDYILQTLMQNEWNISRSATILGIERTNLHKKIRAYGIRRGDGSDVS